MLSHVWWMPSTSKAQAQISDQLRVTWFLLGSTPKFTWLFVPYVRSILSYIIHIHVAIWKFPEMGVPLIIIHFHGIFHYKPSSYWGTPIFGNPQIYSNRYFKVRFEQRHNTNLRGRNAARPHLPLGRAKNRKVAGFGSIFPHLPGEGC